MGRKEGRDHAADRQDGRGPGGALSLLQRRHEFLVSNVANLETPGYRARERSLLSSLRDAHLATSITQLTQLQTALQALLAAGADISRTSLVNLLAI